jgi:lysozyme
MNTLDQAFAFVAKFEGCRLRAYQDIVGVWTIGHGETLGVVPGMVWTQEQADSALRRRLIYFMSGVLARCPGLSGNRLVACVSLAYNIGLGAFGASSVCRLAKRGEFNAAAEKFLLWNKAGGRAVRGLTIRRTAERDLFLIP